MLPLPVAPSATQTLHFRPFRPTREDFDAVVEIYNACWPDDPKTAVQLRATYELEMQSAFLYRRVMAELNGEIVAYAVYREVNYAHIPGKYEIQVNVLPEYRSEGIGRRLFDYVAALLEDYEPKPTILMVETREHHHHALQMIERMPGFELVMRHEVAVLDIEDFDFDYFSRYDERMRAQHIRVSSLREIALDEPQWREKFYDLYWKAYDDVPMNSAATRTTFDDFVMWLEHPCFAADGTFIAIDETSGAWVGLSVILLKLGDHEKLQTDLTGVLRSHRRMGIATAVKVKVIEWAKRTGARYIQTDNEENNPMFLLNLHMGFQRVPAWLTYEKQLKARESLIHGPLLDDM